ncbi:hypothetical protein [Vibrio lentus]|uniref:hypothetical protein n=1 Tax=Vibrio lentus TaxID=136468 RepID=UPI001E44F92B|nr:hypothetical protein [Vibrio lentus]MCC4838071.1 hypothetical protein [Vibrio lentus]
MLTEKQIKMMPLVIQNMTLLFSNLNASPVTPKVFGLEIHDAKGNNLFYECEDHIHTCDDTSKMAASFRMDMAQTIKRHNTYNFELNPLCIDLIPVHLKLLVDNIETFQGSEVVYQFHNGREFIDLPVNEIIKTRIKSNN